MSREHRVVKPYLKYYDQCHGNIIEHLDGLALNLLEDQRTKALASNILASYLTVQGLFYPTA